jgi:hypothetical protein
MGVAAPIIAFSLEGAPQLAAGFFTGGRCFLVSKSILHPNACKDQRVNLYIYLIPGVDKV